MEKVTRRRTKYREIFIGIIQNSNMRGSKIHEKTYLLVNGLEKHDTLAGLHTPKSHPDY